MRSTVLAILVGFTGLSALTACAPREGAAVEANANGRVTTEAGLEAALGRSGFLLQPRGFTTDPLVSASASEYAVGGTGVGYLQVYSFTSDEQAERDTRDVAARGVGGGTRVYRNGSLVVAYYGSDPSLGATLTRLLGPPAL